MRPRVCDVGSTTETPTSQIPAATCTKIHVAAGYAGVIV